YDRIVECAHPPEPLHISTCSGVHAHGHAIVNAWNRRTSRSLLSISGPLSLRLRCWRPQPSSIDSNNAGSGRSGVTPSTSTSAADPATLRACVNGHLHGTRNRCNETGIQCNRIRCLIMTPAATADTQRQLRPRGAQPTHPPRPHPADLEGQLRDVHANCRMMQLMQLRSLNWHGGGGVPRVVQPSVMYTGLAEQRFPL